MLCLFLNFSSVQSYTEDQKFVSNSTITNNCNKHLYSIILPVEKSETIMQNLLFILKVT